MSPWGERPRRVPAVRGSLYAVNFSGWKRPVLQQCFPDAGLRYVRNLSEVPGGGTAVVWGKRDDQQEAGCDVRLLRVEDGFLRSVGLGVDLIRPLSWVIDERGAHYDPSQMSDLEERLSTQRFDAALLERAARLRRRLIDAGVTKYNVGNSWWRRPDQAEKVILVPGQVETDASLTFGASGVRTNLHLLQAVRLGNPSSYVVYKPHPDVVAGMRAKGAEEEAAKHWCNEIVRDVGMGSLLDVVDEVHVMTSLAGFEALLRGKSVTCYGQPFYAGWGLTTDIVPHPRRSRRLTVEELVAGALIEYPVYFSRDGERLVSPEEAVDELIDWRVMAGGEPPWWRKACRVVVRAVVGVR